MSTASGNASKGEKGKKFQSLKINLCAANKPTEPEQQQQHRSSIQRKQHGMTSLGRVPTARRPTNLPSEKAEHGGNDISVNLVPSGGPGWGNKPNESGSTTTPPLSANPPTSVSVNNVTTTGTSQQVPRAQLYQPTSRMAPVPASMGGHAPVHHSHTDVKTWAMMTHGGDTLAPNFLTPQSPLFQHEFPSLSSNSETSSAATPVTAIATQKHTANTTVDTQYGPGPSLRPQTEGSWIQGGSRPQNSMSHAAGSQPATAPAQGRPMSAFPPPAAPDGARNNLGPSGVGAAQAGPNYSSNVPQLPPHFTGMMPQFMLRNNNFVPNFAAVGPMKGPPASRPPPYSSFSGPHSSGDRFMPPGPHAHAGKRAYDEEDVKIRPIVKEEDLNQMANMGNDVGWAAHEDIDYNQKLKFSDDEDDDRNKDNRKTRTRTHFKISDKHLEKESDLRISKESLKDREKSYSVEQRNPEMKNAWQMRRTIIPPAAPSTGRYQIPANGRFEEDDETWQERRRQKKEEMDIIIQRAKERKEEEEKRFNEQQQAATLKLKKLEAAMEANQYGNKENRIPTGSELDMLPPWEKEKYQSVIAANDDSRKSNVSAPVVPVVKDASEFRELTQLVDKNFVKKDVKERESAQATGFSRAFVAPRFQHRQTNAPSGPTRSIISHSTQFTSKTNFSITRLQRSESDSLSDKDRDWKAEDGRKERDADRYSKDSFQERDYGYNHGHEQNNDTEYENKFGKEYEMKSKYYGDKEESSNDSYGGNFDCDSLHTSKTERRISESEKSKGYDVRRYSESENHEKDERGRSYDELEKLRHYGSATSRPQYLLYPEGDTQERKRSREETIYETSKNVDSYKKREKDVETLAHYKKEEGKRDMESFKDERKTSSAYDDRLSRNDHYRRESKESLRDETFNIQDTRYLWTDDMEADEKKLRKDIFREDRGDRYSHGQRHVPRPITRAKLEAKELESDSKAANLTPLVRSDKKIESKKNESEDNAKDKDSRLEKSGSSKTDPAEQPESQAGVPSAWKRDDSKKLKDESNAMATSASAAGYDANKGDDSKDDKNKETTTAAKKDDNAEKIAEDKAAKERRKADARIKDQRNWTRFEGSYQGGGSYGGGRNAALKSRRPNRTTTTTTTSKGGSRRDPKYSESEYSDEVSGSGREDRNMRSDRDKNGRPLKPSSKSRYDRDDRNDYRMDDRDYGNGRGGGGSGGGRNNRDYYYKSAPRGRNSGFRQAAVGSGGGGGKRMDGYGPPSTRTPFGGAASDDKPRSKPPKDASNAAEQSVTEKKGVESKANKPVDRSWKKNVEAQADNKSLSSSASAQAIEANEESFATASEGSDSEDGVCEVPKNKSSYGTTKRSPAVVVTKPPRKFRSTSRKRYDNRRTGAGTGAGASSSSSSYARKDSGSYGNIGSGKRNPPSTGSKPLTKKDGEKYDDGAAISSVGGELVEKSSSASGRKNSDVSPRTPTETKAGDNTVDYPEWFVSGDGSWPTGSTWDKPLFYSSRNRTQPVQRPKIDEAKASEKHSRDYPTGSQNKKAAKPRTNSNPLKSSSSTRPAAGAAASGRKNSDVPPRMQTKAKADDKAADPGYKYVPDGTWPTGSAWDKPLHYASTKRTAPVQRPVGSGANVTTAAIGQEKSLNQAGDHRAETAASYPDQTASSVPTEKVTTKTQVLDNLDGSTPPVQTIIFENTNYKSGPVDLSAKAKLCSGSHPYEKDSKLECSESGVPTYGNETSGSELQSSKHESLQMTLFNKNEDVNDMKLDFNYDSTEFSKLTDDSGKSSKATMELSHAMNMVQAPAEFKIPASVKKVWDGSADQYDDNKYDGGIANTSTSFSPSSFSSHASDPNNGHIYSHVDASGHVQVDDVGGLGHGEVVFNPQLQGVNYGSSNCQAVMIKNDSSGSSSNVCKVKPQPQGCGTNIVNAAQSSVISTTLVSQPPPMSSPSYSFGCSTPQPNLSNGNVAFPQLNFPAYNVSPMPSSPVLFNSSQTASQTPAAAMYPAFQIDNSQVAARSQFGQFGTAFGLSNAALGQTATPYNQAQSLYLPPPTAPPPELYQQQVPQYRLQPQPFGNTQQITSPNTVLISSTTNNSLMSPSIKPATQQISAIGTKAAGFTAAQTSPQVYMAYDATTQLLAANQSYIPSNQLMQRPGNNVVAAGTLSAASNSYYSSATGGGQTGFYPGTNSALQQQTGAAIGLTAFTQSTNQSLNQMQSYGSQLTQQYRSAPQSYMKGSGNAAAMAADFGSNKAMAMSNHDVLTPGFPPTNKRIQPGNKNLQGVPQGIGQHAMSQNAYSYQASNPMRNNGNASKGSQYPHPIQRPVNPGNNSNRANGGGNNSSNSSAAHRMPVRNNSHQLVNNIQQPPSSAYYSTSSAYSTSKLDASQLDSKNESNADAKLADSMKTMSAKNASTDKNSAASNE